MKYMANNTLVTNIDDSICTRSSALQTIDSLLETYAKSEDVNELKELAKKLQKEIKVLKEPLPLFKKGDVVMLKENKLLVDVCQVMLPKSKHKEITYMVQYNHMPNYTCRDFEVKESELQEKPFDYNKVIFDAYLSALVELKNLKKILKH